MTEKKCFFVFLEPAALFESELPTIRFRVNDLFDLAKTLTRFENERYNISHELPPTNTDFYYRLIVLDNKFDAVGVYFIFIPIKSVKYFLDLINDECQLRLNYIRLNTAYPEVN